MCKTISVRVSDDLYARVNELLGHTCYNLSWLIRLYLVYLTSYFESIPTIDDLVESTEIVAKSNNFFDSNNLM